jgi:hypothetical protein
VACGCVGNPVGLFVGNFVGLIVGASVGRFVGENEGGGVGIIVIGGVGGGAGVGSAVGGPPSACETGFGTLAILAPAGTGLASGNFSLIEPKPTMVFA